MDSLALVRSSTPNGSSLTTANTAGNLCRSQTSANNFNPAASLHKRKVEKENKILRYQLPCSKHFYTNTEGSSTYQKHNRKHVVKAESGLSLESDHDPDAFESKNNLKYSVKRFLDAFSMFCSPYALVAIASGIISSCLLGVEKLSDISPLFVIGVLKAMVPMLLMTIYINGLNQLCDVEIDKINKPYLPLASGSFSYTTGVTIVSSCLILSFGIGLMVGSWPSLWVLILSFIVWTGYSVNVPLLRWKKYPVLAAMCLVAAWAFIFPILYSLHTQIFVFKRPVVFSRQPIFSIVIMSFYAIAIALFKDIPDIEGDQAFGINSFSAQLGEKKMFWVCISLLEIGYGFAILAGATSFYLWSNIVTGAGHAILASVLLYHARSIDLSNKDSISSFYKFIWKLMCVEHVLLPLLR